MSNFARIAPARAASTPRPDGGFVLVGVVMFVLALTILGLSLFSLSGYEAQFLGASHRDTQVFYDAWSGIERTKHILAADGDFSAVGTNLPPNVISATATQDGNTTGRIDWTNPQPIVIEVEAQRGAERKRLRGAFSHQQNRELYRDAIAAHRIFVDSDTASTGAHVRVVHVEGTIREQSGLGQYEDEFDGTYLVGTRAVPLPRVAEFIDYWRTRGPSTPNFLPATATAPPTLDFRASTTNPYALFEGPDLPFGPAANDTFGLSMGFETPMDITLNTGGRPVIWLLPEGAHFNHHVRIRASANGTLIVVARATESDRFMQETGARLGLWFRGGVECNSPLILVSDGTVAIDRAVAELDNFGMTQVSIFSRGAFFRGPHGYTPNPPDPDQLVHHDRTLDPTYLFPLQDAGYLPNLLGGISTLFTLVPGEFREVHDSD